MIHFATILGIHSLREVGQAIVNGTVTGASYALLGIAFALIVSVTGRFHFAFGIVYAITAYIAAVAVGDWGFALVPAAVVGLAIAVTLGVLAEAVVYGPIAARAGDNALLAVFVASLGLVIAGENLIRLVWGNDTRNLGGFPQNAYTVAGLNFTLLEVTLVAASLLTAIALTVLLGRTVLGQQIRAVRGNPDMAQAIGVRVRWIFLVVFALATLIGGVAALFNGMRFAVTPDMGNTPVFYAFVVAFVAGTRRSPLVIGAVGLGIGLVESLSTIWVSDNLSALTVFGMLVAVLAYRSVPSGLRELSNALSRTKHTARALRAGQGG
jgi:branched-subunit amino acid ABC-type transport system permease component